VIVDYHMHLRREDSDDIAQTDHTVEAVERYVAAARAVGIEEIGISEHVYYFRETRPFWHVPLELEHCVLPLEPYVDAILEAKQRGLPVKLGLEVDDVPGRHDEMARVLEPFPWDYRLGSIHFIDGRGIDGWPRLIDEVGIDEGWRVYFDRLATAAETGLYDSLAHPDLVKMWGDRPPHDVEEEIYDVFAERISRTGICVEVSSAGLGRPVQELYPARPLLAACRARGTPITLASDAHSADRIGADLEKAVALARDIGYDTVTVFEERRPKQVPLG
jgi:histidinol-phosphatase (PHP family)